MLTGLDSSGNYKLWSLIYGDGGSVGSGSWSDLEEMASAPSGGDYEFKAPFLGEPDVYRGFFVESFSGSEAYDQPFYTHTVLDSSYIDSLWREPVPFNLASEYGLALSHHGSYAWLTRPDGVWRASLSVASLDLSADITGIRQEQEPFSGALTVTLRNDDGRYTSPGQGDIGLLDIGCQLDFSPGCVTGSGNEVSAGQTYFLEAYEHTSAGGKAELKLHARDGWHLARLWGARGQHRWNKSASSYAVKDILAYVLARAGLMLTVKTQSSVITGFYPDFTIGAGTPGTSVVRKLLSFVPDVLYVSGHKAYLVNPLTADSAVYAYGTSHAIRSGSYRQGAWPVNRAEVEGYDSGADEIIVKNTFDWDEIERVYDRTRQNDDRDLGTVSAAADRGAAIMRGADIAAAEGGITVPANCGQETYDVVSLTDSRAGLSASKRRVLGLRLVYNPERSEYYQQLALGGL